MNTWVVIPVKPLNRAKSRLAGVLSATQRVEFALMMYQHVLSLAIQLKAVSGILVISRDSKVLSIAREQGVRTIQETKNSALNPALQRATEVVKLWRANSVLVLPVDLPFITLDDIHQMLEMGRTSEDCIVIATDYEKDGTNALLVRPPGLIEYSYGDGSFARHVAMAREKRASVHVYQSDTIAIDVDTPEDLESYNARVLTGNCSQMLTPFLPDVAL